MAEINRTDPFDTLGAESLLEKIRRKPGMYIGEGSITMLSGVFLGYQMARSRHRIVNGDDEFCVPYDFNDWVAYRLHYKEATSGWKNMILNSCGDEESAFRRFFELRDEYKVRQSRVVAICTKFPPPELFESLVTSWSASRRRRFR